MQDNITVLNSDVEWKDGLVAKPGNTKYTKAAKLSTHQVFRTKTKELMEKVRTKAATEKEAVEVPSAAPQAEETKAPTEVAETTPVAEPKEEVKPSTVNFLADDKIIEKVNNLGVTCLPGPLESTVIGGKKIRVIPDVVASTKHTYQVVGSTIPQEEVKPTEVKEETPVATDANQEVVANDITPASASEEVPVEETAPTFDFCQKLNIGEINEEATAEETSQEVNQQSQTSNITDINEYKEKKLTNYLNNSLGQDLTPVQESNENQSSKILSFKDEYSKLENSKTELENLDNQIAVAEEKKTALSQDYNAAIIKLKEYKEKLEEEKLSRTMRLKTLEGENAEMEWAIAVSNKISNENLEDEESYGAKGLS